MCERKGSVCHVNRNINCLVINVEIIIIVFDIEVRIFIISTFNRLAWFYSKFVYTIQLLQFKTFITFCKHL